MEFLCEVTPGSHEGHQEGRRMRQVNEQQAGNWGSGRVAEPASPRAIPPPTCSSGSRVTSKGMKAV